MTGSRHVWLVCGVAVLVLDTLGSLAARHWGFNYAGLRAVSFILVTALIDATLGWAISSALGATPRAGPPLTLLLITIVALGVAVTGWALGMLGGVVGKVVHRSVAADA
jgi:hypothetical protein